MGIAHSIPAPLRRLFATKRAHEREARNTTIYLFSQTALLGEGQLVDESESGAKVTSSAFVLENGLYLLNPLKVTVHDLQLAWHRGCEAGFRYTDVRTLRGYIDDPKLQHVTAYWATLFEPTNPGPTRHHFGPRV